MHAPIGPTPTQDQQLALFWTLDLLQWNIVGNTGELVFPDLGHMLVIQRVVADVAGDVLLLQPADAVHESWGPWSGPGANESFVPLVRHERLAIVAGSRVLDLHLGQVGRSRDSPRLTSVGEVRIGEQQHGGHVASGNPPRLLGHIEAIGRHQRRR